MDDHRSAARELIALHGTTFAVPKARVLTELACLALAGDRVSLSAAARATGTPKGTVLAWASRGAGFKEVVDLFTSQPALPSPAETFEVLRRRITGEGAPPVTDFLTFRELHFAYIDRRSGKVVRARNNWYQGDAVGQLEAHNRLAMILPPGMIKTTLFGIEYPVYRIFRSRNFRGTVIQKNATEARKLIASVKERLDHDHYHWMIGKLVEQGDEPIECPLCLYTPDQPFKPDQKDRGAVWSQDAFRVLGITSGEKEPTLQAMGVESQLQGSRAEVILLDDVQNPQDALNSPKSSADLLDWLRNTVLGRLYSEQKLVILANQITDDDFAARLVKEYPDWPAVRYPAILPCTTEGCPGDYEACPHLEERVLCPEVWDFAGLMQKRAEVGEKVWWHQWELQESGFDQRTFTRDALEGARTESYRLGEVPRAVTDIFIGVDPAAAASGHCAIVGWGLDRRSKQRFLTDVFNERGLRTWTNVVDEILNMATRLAPHATLRSVCIELAGTQTALIQDPRLNREVRSLGARVVEYRTRTGVGGQAKRDAFDITSIGSLFDGGLISLPYGGTVAEREKVDAFIAQFLAWRVGPDGRSIKHLRRDQVMACLFAESEAFKLANRPEKRPVARRLDLPDFAVRAHKRMHGELDERRLLQRLARQASAPPQALPGSEIL